MDSYHAPRISVITANLNGGRHLRLCLESVAGQTYPHVEHIVIDGGSTDNSLQIINQFSHRLAAWIAEEDSGIADAINKGIRKASGDYLLVLHADDYLIDAEVLSRVESALTSTRTPILACPIIYDTGQSRELRKPESFHWWTNFKQRVWHQGVFCHRNVFESIGMFDTSFRIAMDFDFFLRAKRAGIQLEIGKDPVAVMRSGGISSRTSWPELKERFAEERQAQLKNCNSYLLRVSYAIYWPAYLAFRRIKSVR